MIQGLWTEFLADWSFFPWLEWKWNTEEILNFRITKHVISLSIFGFLLKLFSISMLQTAGFAWKNNPEQKNTFWYINSFIGLLNPIWDGKNQVSLLEKFSHSSNNQVFLLSPFRSVLQKNLRKFIFIHSHVDNLNGAKRLIYNAFTKISQLF